MLKKLVTFSVAGSAAIGAAANITGYTVGSTLYGEAYNILYSVAYDAVHNVNYDESYGTAYHVAYYSAYNMASRATSKAREEGKTLEEVVILSFQSIIREDKTILESVNVRLTPFDEEKAIEELFSPFSSEKIEKAKKMFPIYMRYYFFNFWEIIQESSLPEEKRRKVEERFKSLLLLLGIGDLLDSNITISHLIEAIPSILPPILPSIIAYVSCSSREDFMKNIAL